MKKTFISRSLLRTGGYQEDLWGSRVEMVVHVMMCLCDCDKEGDDVSCSE